MKAMISYSCRQHLTPTLITAIAASLIVVITLLFGIAPALPNWLNDVPMPMVVAQVPTPTAPAASATSLTSGPITPGTERTDPTGIKQVWVSAGCFMMGSSDQQIQEAYTQSKKLDNNTSMKWFIMEQPQHKTCLTQGYWMDEYDVTNAAFDAFVKAGSYSNDQYWSANGLDWKRKNNITAPGKVDWQNQECSQYSSDPQQPRICVSWYEAEAYARWRTETAHDGIIYRLPSEAEWEYAARGPQSLIYPWGNTFDGTVFNFCDKNCPTSYADKTEDDGYKYTSPVDQYPKGKSWVNAYDMAGNVWQWTADCYDAAYYSKRPNPDNDPLNSCTDNTPRVLRGGAWDHNQILARSASRGGLDPLRRYNNLGFRLVASLR